MTSEQLLNKKAPTFSLPNQDNVVKKNKDYTGKWVVLYFYPKDNTPGCTTEAIAFSELKKKFATKNAEIIGISPDSVASHQRFIDKKNLTVELLSDADKKACESYGVWQMKKMAGREYMGVVRTTFLISPQGIIKNIWAQVKVNGHADDVFSHLCTLD